MYSNSIICKGNKYMGRVDKSDQYIAYHNVLRRTIDYRDYVYT